MERVDIAVNTGKMNPGMNVILIEGVVKGYHECPFTLRDMSELTNLEQELITEQDFKTVPSFVYYYDDGQEKLIILMHILFLLDLFSAFLDISILNRVFNLLLLCTCQFFLVEALVHAILAAYAAFLDILLLLVCFAAVQVNVSTDTFGQVLVGLL